MTDRKITPFLWFDDQAEEAANHYVSIFKNAKITNVAHYGDTPVGEKGKVMTVNFELDGQKFVALNGGPQYKFTEAVSFMVNCRGQEEVDYYWNRLTADGGEPGPCGWCKDKYGLSWQITPEELFELMSDEDEAKANRVMNAMLEMGKIVIADLEKAAAGG